MIKVKRYQTCTHNKKSCSQQGLAPFTVTVVDLTFCSFSVTYESFWTAETKIKQQQLQPFYKQFTQPEEGYLLRDRNVGIKFCS